MFKAKLTIVLIGLKEENFDGNKIRTPLDTKLPLYEHIITYMTTL